MSMSTLAEIIRDVAYARSWRGKIKEGFGYFIGRGSDMPIYTGSGGAIEFGTAAEAAGWTDEEIQHYIEVDGYRLSKVVWRMVKRDSPPKAKKLSVKDIKLDNLDI